MAESGGYYDIIGGPNPNGTFDYGLFQFNEIHKADLDWSKILDPLYNAQTAARFTRQGKDWSSWGLGMSGWGGQLYTSNNAAWLQIQASFKAWYDRYPTYVAAAKAVTTNPGVHLSNLKFGLRNGDVTIYQTALRAYLLKAGRLGNINPSGITGYYGLETKAMTAATYRYLAEITKDTKWLAGDLTTPGPSMLLKIGLRSI
jgi:hypothetical protein